VAGTRDVSRASLYRGSINLWVEDELTRAYLPTVWDSPSSEGATKASEPS
jgi:hypothetical protein